jgi:transcriptional regulator with XRE-family HTH domain
MRPMTLPAEVAFYRRLGKTIRYHRMQRGWSQARLGMELGMSAVAVHNWEHGYNRPDLYTLRLLEKALGVCLL